MFNIFQKSEEKNENKEDNFTIEFIQTPTASIERELYVLKREVEKFKQNFDFSFYKPNVGVFGVNSAGKSTFLNALLGSKEFKMGLSETTSEITRLTKSKNIKKIPNVKDEFREYENLKYFNLFDIPGFGKYFSEEILKEILEYLDIIFWMIDISKGITKEDKEFMQYIKNSNAKIMVITNKIDAVIEDELSEGYDEVEKNINFIYNFFKNEGLENNLIGILPISAKKALIGRLKDKNKEFVLLIEYIENLLIYAVFIESFTATAYDILNYLNSDEFIEELEELLPTNEIVDALAYELYEEIYDNTSFMDSLFGSKAEKAKPIINRYANEFRSYFTNHYQNFADHFNQLTNDILNYLYVYNVLIPSNGLNFDINFKRRKISLKIPVNQISENTFFGSSFAEEISNKFYEKTIMAFERVYNELINDVNKHLDLIKDKIVNSINDFQYHLNMGLNQKVDIYQNLIKNFLKA